MAESTNPSAQKQPIKAGPDFSKPGWPEVIHSLSRDEDFYLQFPAKYRPKPLDVAAGGFPVKSSDDVKVQAFFSKKDTTMVVLVNVSEHPQLVDVPHGNGSGYMQAIIAPFGGVISLPEENAKKKLLVKQSQSLYRAFDYIAPKGNCGGSDVFQVPRTNALGSNLDEDGKLVSETRKPFSVIDRLDLCKFIGCSHPHHFDEKGPPLSVEQSYRLIKSLVDAFPGNRELNTPARTPELEPVLNQLTKYIEEDTRAPVNKYVALMMKFANNREKEIRDRQGHGIRTVGR